MKPYGLPRNDNVANPDIADGRIYGLKASRINLPSKCGKIRSNFKSVIKKQNTRRLFKKIERNFGKQECKEFLYE